MPAPFSWSSGCLIFRQASTNQLLTIPSVSWHQAPCRRRCQRVRGGEDAGKRWGPRNLDHVHVCLSRELLLVLRVGIYCPGDLQAIFPARSLCPCQSTRVPSARPRQPGQGLCHHRRFFIVERIVISPRRLLRLGRRDTPARCRVLQSQHQVSGTRRGCAVGARGDCVLRPPHL